MSRLPRYTELKRGGTIRKRNAKRHAKNWTRAYGSPERCAFVASLPCSVPMCPHRPCENAHTANGGVSRKADADTVIPLCAYHHRELHAHGVTSFSRLHRVDLADCAARTEQAWQRHTGAAA